MLRTCANDVQSWVFQLNRLSETERCTAPSFLRPYHFTTLGMHLGTEKRLLKLPPQLSGYAVRMRLWHCLGLQPPSEVAEHDPRGKFVPLVRLDDFGDVYACAAELAEIAKTHGADAETVNSLEISLMEIIGNCFSHSEIGSGLRGLACAQSWPRGSLAQIAIADRGVGIRHSLMGNALLHPDLGMRNACEMATVLGVTSKPGKGHAGYGLALTRQLLEANGGTLVVYSGNEYFLTNGATVSMGGTMVPWPGTLVVLEWNTANPLRVKDVYSSWPQPKGYTDDDFDF